MATTLAAIMNECKSFAAHWSPIKSYGDDDEEEYYTPIYSRIVCIVWHFRASGP